MQALYFYRLDESGRVKGALYNDRGDFLGIEGIPYDVMRSIVLAAWKSGVSLTPELCAKVADAWYHGENKDFLSLLGEFKR